MGLRTWLYNKTFKHLVDKKVEQRMDELESIFSEKLKSVQDAVLCENVTIGEYSYVGQNSFIYPSVNIGRYCSVGRYVTIAPIMHNIDHLSTYTISAPCKEQRHTNIGNDVWVRDKATVMGSVTVGHGAIIATNAVVTKDVPPYAIVVGTPSKILRYRFDKLTIQRLLNSEWWTLDRKQLEHIDMSNVPEALHQIEKLKHQNK